MPMSDERPLPGWAVALIATALALLFFLAVSTTRADSQAVLPQNDLLTLACKHAEHVAAAAQFGVTRCRKVGIVEDGQVADTTIRVWVEGQGVFIVRQSFILSGWTQSTFSAVPVG